MGAIYLISNQGRNAPLASQMITFASSNAQYIETLRAQRRPAGAIAPHSAPAPHAAPRRRRNMPYRPPGALPK